MSSIYQKHYVNVEIPLNSEGKSYTKQSAEAFVLVIWLHTFHPLGGFQSFKHETYQ